MKKSTNFDAKIKAYSAMALCVAGAGAANAQVVYTDINPDVTITNPLDSLAIDFNNDGSLEYTFLRYNWSNNPSNTAVLMLPKIGNGIMASMGYSLPYVSALAVGANIDGTATTWIVYDGSDPYLEAFGLASTFNGTQFGNWNDGLDHYAGCKFLIGTNVHYGWVRLSCVSGGSSATIKDYAYNATPGAGIQAGVTGASIDNNDNIVSNIYAFNKKIYVNFNTEVVGNINVFNSLGELVLNEKINTQKQTIDMMLHSSGIYMVRIETQKGTFIKKINL